MPAARPEDDLTHEPDADPDWRESYAFNFYDEERDFGIWHSIGKKPNKGYSGFTLGTWGSPALGGVAWDQYEDHSGPHTVDGLTYECIKPLERWKLTFEGELAVAPNPDDRRLNRAVFDINRVEDLSTVPFSFDLEFRGASPTYRYHPSKQVKPMFTGHLDQTGLTAGTVEIEGDSFQVSGYGVRDRSWGVRNWQWPSMWRYISIPTDSFHLMLWYIEGTDGVQYLDGFVYEDDELEEVVAYEEALTAEDHPDKPIPKQMEFEISTSKGHDLAFKADVVKLHPIVISNEVDGETIHSWNDRSHVRFTLPGGKVVPGEIEFSERVDHLSL